MEMSLASSARHYCRSFDSIVSGRDISANPFGCIEFPAAVKSELAYSIARALTPALAVGPLSSSTAWQNDKIEYELLQEAAKATAEDPGLGDPEEYYHYIEELALQNELAILACHVLMERFPELTDIEVDGFMLHVAPYPWAEVDPETPEE